MIPYILTVYKKLNYESFFMTHHLIQRLKKLQFLKFIFSKIVKFILENSAKFRKYFLKNIVFTKLTISSSINRLRRQSTICLLLFVQNNVYVQAGVQAVCVGNTGNNVVLLLILFNLDQSLLLSSVGTTVYLQHRLKEMIGIILPNKKVWKVQN